MGDLGKGITIYSFCTGEKRKSGHWEREYRKKFIEKSVEPNVTEEKVVGSGGGRRHRASLKEARHHSDSGLPSAYKPPYARGALMAMEVRARVE